jgi:glycosyltransferase involved in cell wall biosynthesis
MDVVVHTSLREGIARRFPAGAVGKPVVTYELDGAPEVVREGFRTRLPGRRGHREADLELLRDPSLRAEMGARGRASRPSTILPSGW